MTLSLRTKITRFFLAAAILGILVGGPISASPAYAGDCPTAGQDCTGGG